MNKKLLLFAVLFLLASSMGLKAQTISNGNFENWTMVNAFYTPSGMQTVNLQSYYMSQVGNTTRDTASHQGNYCARMETIRKGNQTLAGITSIGLFDGNNGYGGIPYTQKPDTAYIWVKYNIKPNDTAAVGFFFKKLGNTYGYGFQLLTGAVNGWTKLTLPITYGFPVNPDTLIFMSISSISNSNTISGSVLYVDDISFNSGITNISNPGFESWVATTYEDPDDWYAYSFVNMYLANPVVEKTTDAYSGSYAIKLRTQIKDGDTLGYFSNDDIRDNWYGGQAVNRNPFKLTGYYKYTPVGNDTAIVGLQSNRWDASQNKEILVEEKLTKLPAAATYTPFEVMLSYNSWPRVDTLQIAFASSNLVDGPANVQEGSTLIVDSLNLIFFPVGIEEQQTTNPNIQIFPIPAHNEISFRFSGDLANRPKNILIFDAQSKKVMELNTKQPELNSIDVSSLSAGIYFYILESGNKIYKGKFSIR